MEYFIRICEWSKHQHYKDRNPPWIKLHQELFTSLTWAMSDNASRVLAVAIMLLASRTENKIPADPEYIKRIAYLHEIPDFSQLLHCGFIEVIDSEGNKKDASKLLASCKQTVQNAEPETETETETEKRNTKPSARKARSAKGPISNISKNGAASGESRHQRIQQMIMAAWSEHNNGEQCPWGAGDGKQLQTTLGKCPQWPDTHFAQCLMNMYASEGFPRSELPVHFLPRLPSYFSGKRNTYNREVNGNGREHSKADQLSANISAATGRVFGRIGSVPSDNAGSLPKADVERGTPDLARNPKRLFLPGD